MTESVDKWCLACLNKKAEVIAKPCDHEQTCHDCFDKSPNTFVCLVCSIHLTNYMSLTMPDWKKVPEIKEDISDTNEMTNAETMPLFDDLLADLEESEEVDEEEMKKGKTLDDENEGEEYMEDINDIKLSELVAEDREILEKQRRSNKLDPEALSLIEASLKDGESLIEEYKPDEEEEEEDDEDDDEDSDEDEVDSSEEEENEEEDEEEDAETFRPTKKQKQESPTILTPSPSDSKESIPIPSESVSESPKKRKKRDSCYVSQRHLFELLQDAERFTKSLPAKRKRAQRQ